jgi:BR serine/threonine kinase
VNDNVKITDFGFARWMRYSQADTSCGSPHYAAPEIVKGETYDGRKSDIWSAGVILYTLLSGTLPFDDTSIRALIQKVKVGQYRMPDVPIQIRQLIQMISCHLSQKIDPSSDTL